MLKLSLKEIANETGADYNGADAVIEAVCTDTRGLVAGCLFVALKGESFDGHTFIPQALEQGAAYAVSSEASKLNDNRILYVKDTRDALMGIARLHRKSLSAKIAAVTGSVGKTTTKEMIACVAASKFNTVKTEKNLNNEIGLSSTILGLDDTCEVAVLEMGSDGPGQIAKLSLTGLPDIAVVTSIGVSHIEAFGTRDGILKEKMDICAGLAKGSSLILCGDNDLLQTVVRPEFNILRYGIENTECSAFAADIKEHADFTDFEINYNGGKFDARIPCLGRHNVLNALAAFCVGLCLKLPPHVSIEALKNYRPAGMRQNIVVHNSYTVVEDCYNASPDSMQAAFDTLGGYKCDGRRIAVLSDMLELGATSADFHFETGKYAALRGLDYLLCTGEMSREYVRGANSAGMGNAFHYETRDGLFDALKALLRPGDVVWFKASRAMKLEEIIEKIYKLN